MCVIGSTKIHTHILHLSMNVDDQLWLRMHRRHLEYQHQRAIEDRELEKEARIRELEEEEERAAVRADRIAAIKGMLCFPCLFIRKLFSK